MKTNLYHYSPCMYSAMPNELFLSTPALYLNSYLKIYHEDLYDKIQWKKIQLKFLDQQALADQLNELEIDILCISLYVWNKDDIFANLNGLKKLLKKPITVVVGGPSVEVVRNKNYLADHPEIDYASYGQGEKAFADILHEYFGIKKLSLLASKNVSWRVGDKPKVGDFEFLRLDKISPYLVSFDLLKLIVEDPDYQGCKFILPYETSRGCQYNCSFCDWTSGLTFKTYFRKDSIEQELDAIAGLGIVDLHISNANFGQVESDVDTMNIMAKLKKEKGYDFTIICTNFSKLKKERAFKILDIAADSGIVKSVKFAAQDTHEDILKNIERPDVPWPLHKQYINEFNQKFPGVLIEIELIQGLPGQTRESWEENLIEVFPYQPKIYNWHILPNSPAGYDKEFVEKMQLKTTVTNVTDVSRHDPNLLKTEIVTSTFSYNFDDYAYFTLLSSLCMNAKFSKLHKLVDRKTLFRLIKTSNSLPMFLEKIKSIIVECRGEKLLPTTMFFLHKLIIEFSAEFNEEFKTVFKQLKI